MKPSQLLGRLCIAAGFLLLPLACKNRLEVPPQAQLTSSDFFTTSDDAIAGTNAIYNIMRNDNFNEGLFPIFDIMSDDARPGSAPSDQPFVVQATLENFLLNPTSGHESRWYNTLYQAIRRANAVIDRVPSIPMNNGLKNRCLGEAHFLRALFYLDLARGFAHDSVGQGGVPLILTSQPPSPDAVLQVEGPALYHQVILPDLAFAIQNLPPSYGGADLGRATSGAANSLLARAALYFNDFQRARDAATAVINSGQYDLEADFSLAFRAAGNFGKESVFEVGSLPFEDHSANGAGGNSYGQVQAVRGSPNRGYGFNRMSIELMNEFEPGDQRLEKSILRLGEIIDGYTIGGDPETPDSTIVDGVLIEIEVYNEKVWVPGSDPNASNAHHRRMIRFADVLLMAAEGELALGNPMQAAIYINRVRHRAGLADLPTDGSIDMTTALRHERRVELALEGSRFHDLIRWGLAVQELGPLGFKAHKNERLPIPQAEIDITNNKVKQNPGY